MKQFILGVLILAAASTVAYYVSDSVTVTIPGSVTVRIPADESKFGPLSKADGHLRVIFKDGLCEESRKVLVESGALKDGLEARLSIAAQHTIELKLERHSVASVVFAADLGKGGDISIPDLSSPRCCMHIVKRTTFDPTEFTFSDPLVLLDGRSTGRKLSEDFDDHVCRQVRGRIPLAMSETSTNHPHLPRRNGKDLRSFITKFNKIQIHRERQQFASISSVPQQEALLYFGNGDRDFKDTCLEEVSIPFWVPAGQRARQGDYVFPPVTQSRVGLYIWPKKSASERIEQWSRNATERGLSILVDGWIAYSAEIFDVHKAGKPMFFTTEDGNSGYLVVSMLQSLSLIEIKVLP